MVLRRSSLGASDRRDAVQGHRRAGGGLRGRREQAHTAYPFDVSRTLARAYGG